jgi:hypothetical protein
VWQQIAIVGLSLQHPDEAEAAASKSSALAHGNPYVEAGNWRVIAESRQVRGNTQGAVQAQARADAIAQSLTATP